MTADVQQWPFPSRPIAWGKREVGDSIYLFGIFAPPGRKERRLKRIMVVARRFAGTPEPRYEAVVDSSQLTYELKGIARSYEATYPASVKEYKRYLELTPPPANGLGHYRSPNIGPQDGEATYA